MCMMCSGFTSLDSTGGTRDETTSDALCRLRRPSKKTMYAPDSVMVPRNISFDPEVVTPAIAARDAILSDDESKAIRLWQHEPMPFTAKSVTHEDFRQLHIVPPPPMQRQSYSPNPHRLDSRTTNGETYKAIPVERPPPPQPPQYVPSPHKFEARSVTHDDFTAPVVQPPPPVQRQSYSPNPHRLDSRTTNGETYKAIPVERPPPPQLPQYVPSPHKFEARSVTHDDFTAPVVQPPPPAQRQSYSPNPHRLDSRTTNGETYKAIPIPTGVQALGVRTQNDGFHALIASGSYPPCKGAAVFTTTHDHQETVSIKVLALIGHSAGDATRVPLGSFELAGVPSALAGVPQLLVTFELDADMVLRVTAEDRTRAHHGAHVRASITIHDRLPTPERERPSTM